MSGNRRKKGALAVSKLKVGMLIEIDAFYLGHSTRWTIQGKPRSNQLHHITHKNRVHIAPLSRLAKRTWYMALITEFEYKGKLETEKHYHPCSVLLTLDDGTSHKVDLYLQSKARELRILSQ